MDDRLPMTPSTEAPTEQVCGENSEGVAAGGGTDPPPEAKERYPLELNPQQEKPRWEPDGTGRRDVKSPSPRREPKGTA